MDGFDQDVCPNHRFCEPGVETFDKEDIYFFTIGGNDSPTMTAQEQLNQYDPKTCADDPRFKTDFVFGWSCDVVRNAGTLPATSNNLTTVAPEFVAKAFHPKTSAFTVVKDLHKEYINKYCQPTRKAGDPLWSASRDNMVQAMGEFCQSTPATGICSGLVEGVYKKMHVSAKMDSVATNYPAMDVTSGGFVDLCKSRLINAIDGCDIENKDPNGLRWKQGGSFYRDCVTWYVGAQASNADSSSVNSVCNGRILDFAHADVCGLDLPKRPA